MWAQYSASNNSESSDKRPLSSDPKKNSFVRMAAGHLERREKKSINFLSILHSLSSQMNEIICELKEPT